MKADQERVKNLLIDTVTLLCKNSLTYEDELCIEGLLGVKVDHKDVFFVHISETFASLVPKLDSPAVKHRQKRQVHEQHTQEESSHRNISSVTGNTPVHVKQEAHLEEDDELETLEESQSLTHPESVGAQPAQMVAGQRRVVRRHTGTRSPLAQTSTDGSPHTGGYQDSSYQEYSLQGGNGDTDSGEPPAKRQYKVEVEDDSYQSGDGHSDAANNPWPNIAHMGEIASQIAPGTFQESDTSVSQRGGDMMQPGCSTWPVATGLMGSGPSRGPSEMLYSNDLQSSSRKGLEMSPRTPGRVRGGREHKCSVCGRTFNLTHHLTQHARTHTGERPFHCTICGGTFTQQSSLKRHTRGVHSGKTAAYHCTMCRSSFEERADFEEHVKIHETTQPNFYQPEPDPEAELEVPEPDNGHDEDIEEAQASEVDEME